MAGNAPRQRRRLRQPWQCGFCNLQNLKEAEEFEENPDPVVSGSSAELMATTSTSQAARS